MYRTVIIVITSILCCFTYGRIEPEADFSGEQTSPPVRGVSFVQVVRQEQLEPLVGQEPLGQPERLEALVRQVSQGQPEQLERLVQRDQPESSELREQPTRLVRQEQPEPRGPVAPVAPFERLKQLVRQEQREPWVRQVPQERLDVHVVPYTHLDVGWLISAEDYYDRYVKTIIESVIGALEADSSRTFVWDNMYYLSRWWAGQKMMAIIMFLIFTPFTDQGPVNKERLKALIGRSQFHFVGGGFVMNDEEGSPYDGVIHQMSAGLRWLNDTLQQDDVKVSWQVDPSGLSTVTPLLFSLAGYEAHVIARIDYRNYYYYYYCYYYYDC